MTHQARPSNHPIQKPPHRSLDQSIETDVRGNTNFLANTSECSPSLLMLDSSKNKMESRADTESEGTLEKTFSKEGMVTNPTIIWPSSFFMPSPPVLKGMFSGPMSIMENPELLIGIVAIVVAGSITAKEKTSANKKTYTDHYNNLPLQIIDNQDLENEFFGD
jgi:hypothetical protein